MIKKTTIRLCFNVPFNTPIFHPHPHFLLFLWHSFYLHSPEYFRFVTFSFSSKITSSARLPYSHSSPAKAHCGWTLVEISFACSQTSCKSCWHNRETSHSVAKRINEFAAPSKTKDKMTRVKLVRIANRWQPYPPV